MNCALIFAGGTGQRMNTKTRPKQFLELHGKPIILYTIEVFENHPDIDAIVVVCLGDWIPFLQKKLAHYDMPRWWLWCPGALRGRSPFATGWMRSWRRPGPRPRCSCTTGCVRS